MEKDGNYLLSPGQCQTIIGVLLVSLLSSEWDQVVPTSYHRQNCVLGYKDI